MALFTRKKEDRDLSNQSGAITNLLLKKKLIAPQVGDYLLRKNQETQAPIGEIVFQERILPEIELAKVYADFFGVPFIALKDIDIAYETIDRIPESISRKYLLVAFESKDKKVKVAVAKPYRLQSIKQGIIADIKRKKGIDAELYITTTDDINYALESYKKTPTSTKPLPQQIIEEEKEEGPFASAPTTINNFLDFLLSKKIITTTNYKAVEENAKSANKSLEQALREMNIVQPEQLVKAQSAYLNMPYTFLRAIDIPHETLFRLPKEIAKKYQIILFDIVAGKVLKVATSQPENPQVKEVIKFIQDKNNVAVDLFITTPQDVDYYIEKYEEYIEKQQAELDQQEKKEKEEVGTQESEEGAIDIMHTYDEEDKPKDEEADLSKIDLALLIKKDITEKSQFDEIIESKSVPRIVAAAINYALNLKSSDIHIEPSDKDTKVRFRIDGVLHEIADVPHKLHAAIISRIKISAKLRLDEQRVPQDGRFDVRFHERAVDLRISTLPTVHGEKIVMRLLDKTQQIFSLEELGLRGTALAILKENIKKPYGMILSTGPTGSGKSTTLYAILQTINKPEINIVTLEDPVEYEIGGVNQCQAKPQIGFSFAEGLRSVLRQDPDVILVGEIRDNETAGMAIHSALTGHLVLSTLHTNDSAGAIPRLVDLKVEPFLVISSTNLVLAQRLVRKICKDCKQEVALPEGVVADIERELAKIPPKANVTVPRPLKFYKGKGCSNCANSGYSGRIGIFEVLPLSESINKLIAKRASGTDIKNQAIAEGMLTMKQDGLLKVFDGTTTIDEVLRVTSAEISKGGV